MMWEFLDKRKREFQVYYKRRDMYTPRAFWPSHISPFFEGVIVSIETFLVICSVFKRLKPSTQVAVILRRHQFSTLSHIVSSKMIYGLETMRLCRYSDVSKIRQPITICKIVIHQCPRNTLPGFVLQDSTFLDVIKVVPTFAETRS